MEEKEILGEGYGFTLDPNLVLYLPLYQLDGSKFISQDAYGHECTATGTVWRFNGRYFDGVDDKINCGSAASLNPTTGLTILAWLNPTSFSAEHRHIMSRDANPLRVFRFIVAGATGLLNFAFSPFAAEDGLQATTTCTAGAWQLVGVTYKWITDGTSEIRLYLNDSEIKNKTTAGGPIPEATTNNLIGLTAGNAEDFLGAFGEVWMYNTPLSTIEIVHIYNSTKWRYV